MSGGTGEAVLRARGLGKAYLPARSRWALLRDVLRGRRPGTGGAWVLRGVDLEVRRGEALGVMGRNGAGKSTLLQLLAGVLEPTEGTVERHGSVLALLELGASFDPEATGEENARMQLALGGAAPERMPELLAEVLDFSELGEAFGKPVKGYSSGMFVRLAFAVNTALEPAIMLVDEALAVGDVFFQQKCYARIAELRARGTALVLVSHSIPDIERHCGRALVLADGQVRFAGPAYDAAYHYLAMAERPPAAQAAVPVAAGLPVGWPEDAALEPGPPDQLGDGTARLARFAILDGEGRPTRSFVHGQWAHFFAEYAVRDPLGVPMAGVLLKNVRGEQVHGRHTLQTTVPVPAALPAGSRFLVRQSVRLDIAEGDYTVEFGMATVPSDVVERRDALTTEQFYAPARHAARSRPVALHVRWGAARPAPPPPFAGLCDLPGETAAWLVSGAPA